MKAAASLLSSSNTCVHTSPCHHLNIPVEAILLTTLPICSCRAGRTYSDACILSNAHQGRRLLKSMPLLRLGVLLDAEAAKWRRPAERRQLLPQYAPQR